MAKKPASAAKSKPKAKKPAPKKPVKQASSEKPAVKARKWDSATLLVLPGLVLVIVLVTVRLASTAQPDGTGGLGMRPDHNHVNL